jgi:hypothetical protein
MDFKDYHSNHIHYDDRFCNNQLGKTCIHMREHDGDTNEVYLPRIASAA